MPEPTIHLALILLLTGLTVLFLELFIPSAGVLFAISMVCIVSSVVVAFFVHPMLGVALIATDLILACVLPGVVLKIWAKTPFGRRMFLDAPAPLADNDLDSPAITSTDGFDYMTLMGETGKTLTPLRPSGTTDFAGRRVDTVSEGVMIEKGELVRVVSVEGHRVVVRQLDDQ